MTSKEFKRFILDRGWVEDRQCKGSHQRYRFPANGETFVLPLRFKETQTRIANMLSQIKRKEQNPVGASSVR
jgi:predicted RNA binding protein YcfA (HicA-like mRNA interferase family)